MVQTRLLYGKSDNPDTRMWNPTPATTRSPDFWPTDFWPALTLFVYADILLAAMMFPTLKPPKATSIRASALELLREALLSGQYAPGTALSEPALAAEMSISRGPVREALLILAQEGLVAHSQNRGFSVIQLKLEDRIAMARVRLPLESMALELAKTRILPAELQQLEEAKSSLLRSYAAGDVRSAARFDLRFHELVWEFSGNVWLAHALRRIVVPFFVYAMIREAKSDEEKVRMMESQHTLFLEFLRGEATHSAEQCVLRHLTQYERDHDVR